MLALAVQGIPFKERIMKRSHLKKPLIAAMALAFILGASLASAATNKCRFAYDFCMPRYNACIASGTPQSACHAELDACLIRNGCSILP
jgi:hypothetical protein